MSAELLVDCPSQHQKEQESDGHTNDNKLSPWDTNLRQTFDSEFAGKNLVSTGLSNNMFPKQGTAH